MTRATAWLLAAAAAAAVASATMAAGCREVSAGGEVVGWYYSENLNLYESCGIEWPEGSPCIPRSTMCGGMNIAAALDAAYGAGQWAVSNTELGCLGLTEACGPRFTPFVYGAVFSDFTGSGLPWSGNEPIVGARVSAVGQKKSGVVLAQTTTGLDGTFRLDLVPFASYYLTVDLTDAVDRLGNKFWVAETFTETPLGQSLTDVLAKTKWVHDSWKEHGYRLAFAEGDAHGDGGRHQFGDADGDNGYFYLRGEPDRKRTFGNFFENRIRILEQLHVGPVDVTADVYEFYFGFTPAPHYLSEPLDFTSDSHSYTSESTAHTTTKESHPLAFAHAPKYNDN